jgi:hypothetical protein
MHRVFATRKDDVTDLMHLIGGMLSSVEILNRGRSKEPTAEWMRTNRLAYKTKPMGSDEYPLENAEFPLRMRRAETRIMEQREEPFQAVVEANVPRRKMNLLQERYSGRPMANIVTLCHPE